MLTETATVTPMVETGSSRGRPTYAEGEPMEVSVLFAPTGSADDYSDETPDGVRMDGTIYLTDPGIDWRDAKVTLRGTDYKVVGSPQAWLGSPVRCNIAVGLVRYA